MARMLLVDDDAEVLANQIRKAIPEPLPAIEVARTGREGLALVAAGSPDVVLLDYCLPDRPGIEVFDGIRAACGGIPIVFVTHSKTADSAIQAMKRGAFDYLYKPLAPVELARVIGAALETSRQMNAPQPLVKVFPEDNDTGELVGECPAMREVYKSIGRVTNREISVLITGESGTGKELVARSIHQHSNRGNRPFFAMNCAAIPEHLLESELFGHEKGAFTGADRRRIGRFEQCTGGTLFLDEIADMPISLQAKMLRVLQDQSFQRVGGDETIKTDVRIISATHRDLKALISTERFRLDLYYRLSGYTIHLPPLRDRGEDLPLLVYHFFRRFSRELNRNVRDASPQTLTQLQAYSWPGNVRELQSVLKQSLLQATGPTLLPAMLPQLENQHSICSANGEVNPCQPGLKEFIQDKLAAGSELIYEDAHRELDSFLLREVMEFTRGNQFQAAKILGIARQTLRRRLRELKISPRFAVEPTPATAISL